jgi:hypothetical protein
VRAGLERDPGRRRCARLPADAHSHPRRHSHCNLFIACGKTHRAAVGSFERARQTGEAGMKYRCSIASRASSSGGLRHERHQGVSRQILPGSRPGCGRGGRCRPRSTAGRTRLSRRCCHQLRGSKGSCAFQTLQVDGVRRGPEPWHRSRVPGWPSQNPSLHMDHRDWGGRSTGSEERDRAPLRRCATRTTGLDGRPDVQGVGVLPSAAATVMRVARRSVPGCCLPRCARS